MTTPVYAHKVDWEGPALDELAGAVVFNAPRPLRGPLTWTGEVRHGAFYAAVWPETPRRDALVAANTADDAREVQFVDNAAVERMVAAELARAGYSLADYHDIGMSTGDVARNRGYPWRDVAAPDELTYYALFNRGDHFVGVTTVEPPRSPRDNRYGVVTVVGSMEEALRLREAGTIPRDAADAMVAGFIAHHFGGHRAAAPEPPEASL